MYRCKTAVSRTVFALWSLALGSGVYAGGVHGAAEAVSPTPAAARSDPAAGTEARAALRAAAVAAYDAKNYGEALRLFRSLADQGDADAQYRVGRMYQKGEGVRKDDEQMKQWYLRAAEGGHAEAQYRVAVGYALGVAGVRRNDQEAAKWLHRSAEGGHKKAQKYLGRAYADGRFGLPQDPVRADYWTRKSQEK